jgi:lipopolysaccharide export system protein LptA
MSWQRRTRLVLLVAAVAMAIAVAAAFKRRPEPRVSPLVLPADPKAVVESASGLKSRLNRDQEEVRTEYQTFTAYPDGSIKARGVKVTTVRAGGRTFVISGKEADLGPNEASMSVNGDVRVTASDGMEIRTEHASYAEADSLVRAPGPVEFSRGRLTGSGVGATYHKKVDVLTIGERAVVHLSPDAAGAGAADITAGAVEFNRTDHVIQFTGSVTVARGGQTLEADTATAHLTPDEQRLQSLDLRGNGRVTVEKSAVGGLKGMQAREIGLIYGTDGQTLARATLNGDASVQVSGERGQGDRKIDSPTLDIALAADGSTPTSLAARQSVKLTMPGEREAPTRTIEASGLDGSGEAGRGLTRARFTGGVLFHERGSRLDRTGRSASLDVVLKPGFSEIEDARFEQGVRFEEGTLVANAASARYLIGKGALELTGSEPRNPAPHVENERISVGASRIDVVLAGPVVSASGTVKSELKPQKNPGTESTEQRATGKVPSMFKQDQLVAATADSLIYDGAASTATYSGGAQLWQGDTSIKAPTIVLNESTGDLSASGQVVTSITLEQDGKDKKRERVRTTAAAGTFVYEESSRRATYVGDAHMNGPQGDMAAARIELYLKPSGNELERAEAYDAVTLRDQNRETRGSRMTYFSADERYVVTGTPVTITDECKRVTTGQTVIFNKTADTVVVDGNEQTRTQSRGGANCPSQ